MKNLTLVLAIIFGIYGLPKTALCAQKPNIVFLLADDLGWTGLKCFGSDFYETPNLDRLAAQGTKFTNAYAACTVCSPTRASIMTGQYPARLHLTDFIAGQNRPYAQLKIPNWTKKLEHKHMTMAEALKAAGYQTALVGKWHLAPRPPDAEYGDPKHHGFNIQHLKPRQARGYHLPRGFNQEGESKSDYVTDYLTDKALEIIDQNKSQPFFLYFAYHTPHTPIQGRDDLVEYFKGKVNPRSRHKNPTYAAMVKSLDQSVGRILDRLERHDLARNTIVVFTSDNGGLTQRYGKHDGFTENLPLCRGKGSAYEGGVRVPTIIRWPNVTQPGTQCDTPIMSIDYLPTVLEMAFITNSVSVENMDGKSLIPLLKNPETQWQRDLFWHYPHYHAGGDGPYSAIRSGYWRLIEFHENKKVELYNLKQDLGEQINLAQTSTKKADELRAKLNRWRHKVNAQMPEKNPNHDPARSTQVGR